MSVTAASIEPDDIAITDSNGDVLAIIAAHEGSGEIASYLERAQGGEPGDQLYNASLDGIESFLLALAADGVDVTSPKFGEAIRTAQDAMGNYFSDEADVIATPGGNAWTVVGFYADTKQRFCDHVTAETAAVAESDAAENGVTIVAVFPGYLHAADTKEHVEL